MHTHTHTHAWVARFTNPYCLCVLKCLCSSPSFLMFCLPLWSYSRILLVFLNKVPAVMFVGRALLRGEFCESGERNHVQCRVLVWGCCRASIAFFHGESPLLTVDWACEFTYSFFPFCLAVLCFFSAHQRRRNKSEAPESCLLRPNQLCRRVWFRWFDSLVMVSSLVGLAAAYKTGSRQ